MSAPADYPFNEGPGLDLSERYAEARRGPGLRRVRLPYGDPAWLVTRYADARSVLADPLFSRAACVANDEPREAPGQVNRGLLAMDPPDHTRLRRLLAKAFTVQRMERMRPEVRALAERLADDMVAAGQPADLVESFALPLPVTVICRLLGVPEADLPLFRRWSDDAVSSSVSAQEAEASILRFHAYMSDLVAERRERPGDDLMTALIEARDNEDRLSEAELFEQCVGLLIAGHESTATSIPAFLYTLFQHPEQMERLREEPELIPAAVEELLRYVPLRGGALAARWATRDVEVGGTLVREGEPVVVSVGSADRDAERFPDPDTLDFERPANQHMGFGHGVHYCPGSALARLEIQEALRALLLRVPGLRLAGGLVWRSRMSLRGLREMPVGW
ncbi:cytochrome P450 [Streptomyces sp. NPDC004539]|uniref:cytochrome P450 n=1 Tax=Streptomyces sp. NPDC004539 TaxID=3154280 RepID=UPI0033B71206